MKYFKITDFEKTNTGLDNFLSIEDMNDCIWFVENILDKIRERFGRPIYINSGYRSELVNKKVNGSKISDHRSIGKIFACDMNTKGYNKDLFELIKKMEKEGIISYKQLINEYGYKWIHISSYTFEDYKKNKNHILKIG